jgi:hypothetical protein
MCAALLIALPGRTSRAAEDGPAATTKPDKVADKFYGAISAIDKDAKTITIDNQVYHIIDTTQMTKAADDSAATLADATVGEPARGSYTKAPDGQLNVTKVRFGKKSGGGKAGGKSGGKKKATTEATPQQ